MEKRLGVVAILLTNRGSVSELNQLLTNFSDIISARQGLPIKEKGIHVITLIVEGTTDETGALTGKIGKLPGCQVKSILTEYREENLDVPK